MRVVRVFGLVTQIACCATVVTGGPAEGNAADSPPGDPNRSGADAGSRPPASVEAAARARPSAPGAPAGGDRPVVTFIGGTSACPLPADVWNELGTLVPADRLMDYQAAQNAALPASGPGAGAPPPPSVEIVDLGDRYRVIAGGRVREYRNQGRDCTYRARVAAVFVALAVDPAALAVEPPPPASAPQPSPPPAPEAAPPPATSSEATAEHVVDVELLVAVDRSAGGGPQATHTGAGVRLLLGRGPLAFVVGAMAFRTADSTLGGVGLTQGHDPLELGVRLHAQQFFFEPFAEIGLALALLSEEGSQTSLPMKSRAIELGGFLLAGIRVPAQSRVGLVLAARGEWVPSPADLTVLPTGGLGHAPALWYGATAGATVGF